jgi:hypothetical protein
MNKYDDNKQDIRKEHGMFHVTDEISGNNCYLLNRIDFLWNLLFCFYIQKPKPMHLCQPRFDPKNFYSFQGNIFNGSKLYGYNRYNSYCTLFNKMKFKNQRRN